MKLFMIVLISSISAVISSCRSNDYNSANSVRPSGGGSPSSFQDARVIPEAFQEHEKQPYWPKPPRRDVTHQETHVRSIWREISVAVSDVVPLKIADLQKKILKEFTWTTSIASWVIATNDISKNESLFKQIDQLWVLDYWQEREMIKTCILTSQYTIDREFSGKVKILTFGKGGSESFESTTKITQLGKFERPQVNEPIAEVIEACNRELMSEKAQESIKRDLDAAIASVYLSAEGSSCLEDRDCLGLGSDGVIYGKTARSTCVRNPGKSFYCALRGYEGANCRVYGKTLKNGEREVLSSGMFELPCADGYQCKVVEEKNFWLGRSAVGRCARI